MAHSNFFRYLQLLLASDRWSGGGSMKFDKHFLHLSMSSGVIISWLQAFFECKPTIVTNAEGQRVTLSVVAYTFSVKRFIGRMMTEVSDESTRVSYRPVKDDNVNVKLDFPAIEKQFATEEISAQGRT